MANKMVPTWPIFEKSSHLREKGGVLMLLKTTRHLGAKAQYLVQARVAPQLPRTCRAGTTAPFR
jgi:hypothetical protein